MSYPRPSVGNMLPDQIRREAADREVDAWIAEIADTWSHLSPEDQRWMRWKMCRALPMILQHDRECHCLGLAHETTCPELESEG